MFIHLKHSIYLYLLLQFLGNSEQATYSHTFPSFPKEVPTSNITINHKYNGPSEVVFAKCPGPQYKHNDTNDKFVINEDLNKTDLHTFTFDKMFFWMPVRYDPTRANHIYCGVMRMHENTSQTFTNYTWSLNLKWEKKPYSSEKVILFHVSTRLPPFNFCSHNKKEILIYFMDKINGLRKLQLDDRVLGHINDLYYYFKIPDSNMEEEIKEPCVIIKAINEEPKIIIKEHNSISIPFNNLDFQFIKHDNSEKLYSMKLFLKNETYVPNFYEGEQVKMTRIRFRRNGIEEIANTDEMTTSNFSIKGYEVVKFSYDCPQEYGIKKIETFFYFGPELGEYNFPTQRTIYNSNDTSIQPNCSVHMVDYGYLDSIIVDGIKVNLNELKDGGEEKDNLKRVKDFVFISNVMRNNVTLYCVHATPFGNVTFVENFLKRVDEVVRYDENGVEVHDLKKMNIDTVDELEKKVAEKEKELAEKVKPTLEKLKDKIGTIGVYIIIIVIVIFVLNIVLIFGKLWFLRFFKISLDRKRNQNEHSNIFRFWNELSNQNLEKYLESIQLEKYIPDKIKDQKVSKKIEGGEEVEVNENSCFDDSLVKCYKDINKEIKVHYINGVSPLRTYIISDGPAPEKVGWFWELLYRENVEAVVAIIYQPNEVIKSTNKKIFYWPEYRNSYGKVVVQFRGNIKSDTPFVEIKKFSMTMRNGVFKYLTIFHVKNWKEHEILRSDLHLVKLYEKVSKFTTIGNVLIHTSYGSASRVFMYTYFSCIFEAMRGNDTVDDPLEIIKKIREQRYGGNISSMEYAYIIKALVTNFFKNNLLHDVTNHLSTFTEEYDNYMLKLDAHECKMDPSIKNFLTFVNVIDEGKLKNICDQTTNLQMLNDEDGKVQCKRFYDIANTNTKFKIRYINIPCLDETSIIIRGKGFNDSEGFIHANEFSYKYDEEKVRKIIMCQGPLKETMDDMLDMIHRYKIGIVVILLNKNEMGKEDKCFGYLHTNDAPISYGSYSLVYKRHKTGQNKFFIEYDYSIIDNTSKMEHDFKVLHYLNWPDRTIPIEKQSFYGLYIRIMELNDNRHIAIHCSNGIGRTGTLALLIYMIDEINSKRSFDPIKCLAVVRQHRYKAVQTTTQFVFALSILYEHFKEQIDNMDKQAYKNFMNLAQNFYNQNNKVGAKREA